MQKELIDFMVFYLIGLGLLTLISIHGYKKIYYIEKN